jgi:hypothetical protein
LTDAKLGKYTEKCIYLVITTIHVMYLEKRTRNSYLLYEFYKTLFCRTRFLEHEERSDECYKANKCDKMTYKTSIIQYFFYFAP